MNVLEFLEAVQAREANMSAIEVLFEKQANNVELTAIEQVILDAFYRGGMAVLANMAANELRDMTERIKEHLPR